MMVHDQQNITGSTVHRVLFCCLRRDQSKIQ